MLKYMGKVWLACENFLIEHKHLFWILISCMVFQTLSFLCLGVDGAVRLWGSSSMMFVKHEYWRGLTYSLLHNGLPHFIVNMFTLCVVGRFVTYLYGRPYMLWCLLFSCLFGSLVGGLLDSPYFSIGLSGGVFGLYGSWLVAVFYRESFLPEGSERLRRNTLVEIFFIILYFTVMDLYFQIKISHLTHIGGVLCGLILGRWKFRYVPERVREFREQVLGLSYDSEEIISSQERQIAK